MSDKGFTTRALRSQEADGPGTPVSVPIYETSTFAFDDAAELAKTIETAKDAGYVYTRWHNPTRAALEAAVADLEGGEAAVSFSSGMAAITTVLTTLTQAGDHVVSSPDLYGGSFAVLNKLLPRWGVETSVAASHRVTDLVAAMHGGTRACYVETIGNPTCSVTDLPAMGKICRERDVRLVVDSTFTTPYLCTPLMSGADVVVHSTTKYIGGHHDIIGGIAVGDTDTMRAIREMGIDLGGVPSPFDAWLALRGLATLALRMDRHCGTAMRLATLLEQHPKVTRAWYPGLTSHPDHEVADRTLRGFSGMLAFELEGGLEAGRRFVESVEIAKMAASLGGVHTLVIHPASVTHTQLTPEQREAAGVTDGLVRVSVGIEDPEDLELDFSRALGRA